MRLEQDDLVSIAPVARPQEPAPGEAGGAPRGPSRRDRNRRDAGRLERRTLFVVGASRLLVEHTSRGSFWFDAPDTALAKGDAVAIGGLLSAGEITIATTLVHAGSIVVERTAAQRSECSRQKTRSSSA